MGSEQDDRNGAPRDEGSGVGVAAGVTDGYGRGTVDGAEAGVAAGVDGALDTGTTRYEGGVDGDVAMDLGSGAVEGGGAVSFAQDDLVSGRTEGEVEGDVQIGPASFGAGAGSSLRYTDPLGAATQGVDASGSYHHQVDAGGVEAGAAVEGTVDSPAGDSYHGGAEADLEFGRGALDVEGSATLSHTAPFGVASESLDVEGRGHVDGSGWEAEGDVRYELDVGGGAPEVAIGGGFSTSGEWSDVEDAAGDAGDTAQDAYNDAEDTANDAEDEAGDAYEDAEDEVGSWF